MKFFKAFFLILGLAYLCVSTGCGYTRKTMLPDNIETIYVDTVRNKIPIGEVYAYQPGLEIEITNAIIRRLHRDGNLRVAEREDADAIFQFTMKVYEQEGLRFSSLEQVEEYRLFIQGDARLLNAKTDEVIWKESNFSGSAEYFVSDVRSISREEASKRAVDRLARNLVDRIVEDW